MIISVINIILSFAFPLFILRNRNTKLVSSLGIAGCAYAGGLLFSLAVSLFQMLGIVSDVDTSANEILCYFGIALAIPLLMFSGNISFAGKLSKKILLCFSLLVVSVAAVSFAVYMIFGRELEGGETLSGMAVALYTGGTPNLNAVAYIFGLDNSLIFAANISDIVFGGLFLAFLLFGAKPFLSKYMKQSTAQSDVSCEELYDESVKADFSLKNKGFIRNILIAFALVVLSLALGAVIWLILGKEDGKLTDILLPVLMVSVTIGGILLSFSPKIRAVNGNTVAGQYFAAIFSFSISSIINLQSLASIQLNIFLIFALITLFSFLLHSLLCKFFGIDVDLMITVSVAGIYGPAFVPTVTQAIKAERLLPVGLILGSLGYAIGTFLGILFINLLLLI